VCSGIEYSDCAARLARERGFVVHSGRVEDTLDAIPDNSPDVIIASFVMEHLENPFRVTETLNAKLRPLGQFIYSTLNINSPDFRLWRENWYDLDLPRHFTFFRKRDIYQMLEKHFEIRGVYYPISPNDYVGSARYWLKRNSLTHSTN
jgi:2-polyprenyl-3-methyl-5-hydroxy-6-metoxy-1,4-benzoquinol methylase